MCRIRRKRLGILSDGVIHLLDNTRSHLLSKLKNCCKSSVEGILEPLPIDLAPVNISFFPNLKENLFGKVTSVSDVETAAEIVSMGGDMIFTKPGCTSYCVQINAPK
ncbi:hypothetical protein AVEN_233443-1 [Araneus ventricosus]|uniref:Uncharacterized protein n=1 Tax=Araneus ventricosus TaxID=182803 RepID=A0A4Y2SD03_ARAVE|nr:hypothetical protein AVEN_233443-1 [Araneus ventricosus]